MRERHCTWKGKRQKRQNVRHVFAGQLPCQRGRVYNVQWCCVQKIVNYHLFLLCVFPAKYEGRLEVIHSALCRGLTQTKVIKVVLQGGRCKS